GRRTSFVWIPRATASRSPCPASLRRSERKYTWKSRSPSSSSSFSGRSAKAASATSYASSPVCGTIVRAVCSRSQGQSRRSRSVSCCSSSSASASVLPPYADGSAGGRARGLLAGMLARRRLVAGLVADRLAVVLLHVLLPLLQRLRAVVREQGLADPLLHLRERRRVRGRGRLDRPERLDDVPAEPRVGRLRDLVHGQRERDLLERRVEGAFRVRVLAAGRLRGRSLAGPRRAELLLELRDPGVDVLVGRRLHAHALRFLLVLASGDQRLRRACAQRRELDRAGLRIRVVRRRVIPLRQRHELV